MRPIHFVLGLDCFVAGTPRNDRTSIPISLRAKRSNFKKRNCYTIKMILSAVFLVVWIPFAVAHEAHSSKPSPPAELPKGEAQSQDPEAKKRNYFTDSKLITQNGEEVRFYSDILKDKVVLINFFFTDCVSACPLQSKVLADLQPMLGDRLGKDIVLVSISVDPERDTPIAMKGYAEGFGAEEGWVFLSGKKDAVNQVIYKLGQYVEDIDAHSTAYILGNAKTDHWKKVRPNVTAKALATLLLGLAEENGSGEE